MRLFLIVPDVILLILLLRLPPFIILLIVFEELVPVLAVYCPSLLPSTCVLPSQRVKIAERKDARQLHWAAKMKGTQLESGANGVSGLATEHVRVVCGYVHENLSSSSSFRFAY